MKMRLHSEAFRSVGLGETGGVGFALGAGLAGEGDCGVGGRLQVRDCQVEALRAGRFGFWAEED
jgi:hypothetical protein